MREKISLRPLQIEDAAITWHWRNQPAVMDFFSGHSFSVTYEDELRWMEQEIIPSSAKRSFGVSLASTNELIGMTFLKNFQTNHRQAEFAILIDAAHTGMGYGKAACYETFRIAFRELGLHRVFLKVRVDNLAAIRIYEACGMQVEGRLRDDMYKNGRFVDQFIMSVLEHEFNNH